MGFLSGIHTLVVSVCEPTIFKVLPYLTNAVTVRFAQDCPDFSPWAKFLEQIKSVDLVQDNSSPHRLLPHLSPNLRYLTIATLTPAAAEQLTRFTELSSLVIRRVNPELLINVLPNMKQLKRLILEISMPEVDLLVLRRFLETIPPSVTKLTVIALPTELHKVVPNHITEFYA